MIKMFLPFVLCYVLGSFPTAVLLSKACRGVDVRTLGTGNAGASNMLIQIGPVWGVLTAIIDIAKGALCTLLPLWILGPNWSYACIGGAVGILGHIFPLFADFKGGKGLACLVGMSVSLAGWIGAALVGGFVCLTLLTGYIALGAVCLCFALLLYIHLAGASVLAQCIFCVVFIVMCIKHLENFKRILSGTEENVNHVLFKRNKS